MDLVDTPKLFLLSSYFTTQFNAAMHTSQMCFTVLQIHQNPDTVGSTHRFDLSVFAWESTTLQHPSMYLHSLHTYTCTACDSL